jgi:hypothetical protein
MGTPSPWTIYSGSGEVTVDLSGFPGDDIQTEYYLYLKDALGNGAETPIPVSVHANAPLYIDTTPPEVGGTLSIDSTGEISGITISDPGTYAAGFDHTVSSNYVVSSVEAGTSTPNLYPTITYDSGTSTYTITGGIPTLPSSGTVGYTITLTVKDKGGVEQAYKIDVEVTVTAGPPEDIAYAFTGTGTWVASGSPIIPTSMRVPFAFTPPFSAPSPAWSPVLSYGSIGGVRYPLAGLARVPVRSGGTVSGQSAVRVSYSYSGGNAEYLHPSYSLSSRNSRSSGEPVLVTMVSEPASLRPARVRTAPQNAGHDPAPYTEDPAAGEFELGDYGPSLSASPASLPADSPVPVNSPPDNHKVPFRNPDFNPFILPQDAGSGSQAKGRRGTEGDEEVQ